MDIWQKGSDWIRLVFAHPFALNGRAPIPSANFISDGKVQVSPYTLMMELAQLIGAPLFKTKGWAQSSPHQVSPFAMTSPAIQGLYSAGQKSCTFI